MDAALISNSSSTLTHMRNTPNSTSLHAGPCHIHFPRLCDLALAGMRRANHGAALFQATDPAPSTSSCLVADPPTSPARIPIGALSGSPLLRSVASSLWISLASRRGLLRRGAVLCSITKASSVAGHAVLCRVRFVASFVILRRGAVVFRGSQGLRLRCCCLAGSSPASPSTV